MQDFVTVDPMTVVCCQAIDQSLLPLKPQKQLEHSVAKQPKSTRSRSTPRTGSVSFTADGQRIVNAFGVLSSLLQNRLTASELSGWRAVVVLQPLASEGQAGSTHRSVAAAIDSALSAVGVEGSTSPATSPIAPPAKVQ